jgi:hypothetical protein
MKPQADRMKGRQRAERKPGLMLAPPATGEATSNRRHGSVGGTHPVKETHPSDVRPTTTPNKRLTWGNESRHPEGGAREKIARAQGLGPSGRTQRN